MPLILDCPGFALARTPPPPAYSRVPRVVHHTPAAGHDGCSLVLGADLGEAVAGLGGEVVLADVVKVAADAAQPARPRLGDAHRRGRLPVKVHGRTE